jgi:hypothetical protein
VHGKHIEKIGEAGNRQSTMKIPRVGPRNFLNKTSSTAGLAHLDFRDSTLFGVKACESNDGVKKGV